MSDRKPMSGRILLPVLKKYPRRTALLTAGGAVLAVLGIRRLSIGASVTYADQLAALGADVDNQIATITQQPPGTGHADSGRAVGASWDTDLANAKPPPPPPTGTRLGASNPAVSQAKSGPLHVVRAFNPSQAQLVPAGVPVVYSNDGNRANEYALAAHSPATLALWEADLRANIRDDADSFVAILHEEDTPANGGNYARWAQCYAGLRTVVDTVNVGRTHPIRTISITTGQVYANGTYGHWDCPAVDVIGVDNYRRTGWGTIDTFAKSVNKPWGLCEWGLDATHAAPATDPNVYINAMDADLAQFNGKALFGCWFFAGRNLLSSPALAPAAAHLKTLVAASA